VVLKVFDPSIYLETPTCPELYVVDVWFGENGQHLPFNPELLKKISVDGLSFKDRGHESCLIRGHVWVGKPQESFRVRCTSVVGLIHEKLSGMEDSEGKEWFFFEDFRTFVRAQRMAQALKKIRELEQYMTDLKNYKPWTRKEEELYS
jgi:hypothetical protein